MIELLKLLSRISFRAAYWAVAVFVVAMVGSLIALNGDDGPFTRINDGQPVEFRGLSLSDWIALASLAVAIIGTILGTIFAVLSRRLAKRALDIQLAAMGAQTATVPPLPAATAPAASAPASPAPSPQPTPPPQAAAEKPEGKGE